MDNNGKLLINHRKTTGRYCKNYLKWIIMDINGALELEKSLNSRIWAMSIIVLAMFFWVFPAMNLSSHKNFCTGAMIIAVFVRPPFLDHPLPLVKTPTELGDVCFTWQL